MNLNICLDFLNDLKKNNNREWFQQNKPSYESAREVFLHFVEILVSEIQNIDPEIGAVIPSKTLYRIYRDVRFSKDKSPYKTNFGAHIVKDGKKSGNAGYYFHLEPGGTFIAGGVYQPMPDSLKMVRTEIFENPDEFRAIIESPQFRKNFNELWGDKLKTAPKGFPKDFPDIDLLKYKSYIVAKNLSDTSLSGNKLITELKEILQSLYPLNRFLNYILSGE